MGDNSKYTKDAIQTLLMRTDDVGMHAVGRAIVALDNEQTESERQTKEVLRNNQKGFTPADAYMGTSMAAWYTENKFLSKKQLEYWRKPNAQGIPRICKYWKQLQKIAMEKHGIISLRDRRIDPDQLAFPDSC